MAYSILPTYPLLIFGILEPGLLIWAYIINLRDPADFYIRQHPTATSLTTAVTSQALSISLQIGNVFLLLAFLAIICCWTSHPEIAKRYLFAVALADFGHIYATYASLEGDIFWEVTKWNDMVWGSVGVSVFLNIHRWAALLGVFGTVGGRKTPTRKKQK